MEYIPVILLALVGSCLSFFSGFGLGTLLLPAFMVFLPPEVAVAATAVVHMLNNVFKLFLVGRYADRSIVLYFGLLSVVGAFFGALSLEWIGAAGPIFTYHIGEHLLEVTVLKLVMGILIILFAFLEILPRFKAFRIHPRLLPLGGLLSGFFGGLSGQQGALRSAFLMKAGLSKEAFMGTRVVCACLVDLTRLSVYASLMGSAITRVDPVILTVATLSAFTGAWIGNKWMKKTELKVINAIVTVCLVVFGCLLAMGVV